MVLSHFFYTLIKLQFRFTSLMWRCSSAYLIVVYTLVDTSHSFRIGGAVMLPNRVILMRALGRWKSDVFEVYLSSEVLYAK